jgi:hypothetical protein
MGSHKVAVRSSLWLGSILYEFINLENEKLHFSQQD